MPHRPFRFGVNMVEPSPRTQWRAKCRTAEQLGYDVILVPDHLGMAAPFPAVVAAAEATERPRVGTFVLNAGFWNPTLLAREVATTDLLTDGRLELGLGTGYVRAEHDAAGLPWGSPGERVDHLRHTVETLDRHFAEAGFVPKPGQTPRPPLLIGGNGEKMLRLTAEHADIAAFTGARSVPGHTGGKMLHLTAEEMDERVASYRRHAAGRPAPAELNLLIQLVDITDDRRAKGREVADFVPHLTVDAALDVPILLMGTVRQIADQLRAQRERYGFSYITVLEPYFEVFGPVIEELRGE
ncbi:MULTISPECIES: LLM class F420-dependent oxidoreductase [Streptomyces]|uniref:5,10-methylene tetrahydromethanopterin reductase n=1 Tax=Streptomyces alboflavus TaxID=67267 RepID=A0A1Z1W5Z5_9ACTN|nr:LLM class F420-dependent oxidoreductase [Streptomyces alboflavus]ARX81845.1 5,10-methylene tetrahydromethanopterin reductase [Streptomyces alboflavus]